MIVMAKGTIYVCDSCGNETLKWQGRCPVCGEWNTLKEVKNPHLQQRHGFGLKTEVSFSGSRGTKTPCSLAKVREDRQGRVETGIDEFDRVLGGGFVPGTLVLLGGEPGIGKSTLLLQVASLLNKKVLYASGEESEGQIKIRSKRIARRGGEIDLLSTQNLEDIVTAAKKKYALLVVDSIQTVFDPGIGGQIGGIAQVKGSAYQLQALAKDKDLAVVLVGHITKEGRVAGPKTLEHLVDTVLYLEGDRYHHQRIIRATKNRFGSTGETGIFQMTKAGLEEVKNPSALFLEQRAANAGSAVTAIIEGKRPLLIEVQALTEKSVFGYPKRRAQGITLNRLEMLAAVLSKRTDLNLADKDIYVNIVGGLTIQEPAADLAIVLAIASSVINQPINNKLIGLGEVGLGGEIRMINDLEIRLREAGRLGFKKALISKSKGRKFVSKMISIKQVSTLAEAIKEMN